ncbi:unnamed protein product [Ixodes pacificus]
MQKSCLLIKVFFFVRKVIFPELRRQYFFFRLSMLVSAFWSEHFAGASRPRWESFPAVVKKRGTGGARTLSCV